MKHRCQMTSWLPLCRRHIKQRPFPFQVRANLICTSGTVDMQQGYFCPNRAGAMLTCACDHKHQVDKVYICTAAVIAELA